MNNIWSLSQKHADDVGLSLVRTNYPTRKKQVSYWQYLSVSISSFKEGILFCPRLPAYYGSYTG